MTWYRANLSKLWKAQFPRVPATVFGIWSSEDVALAEEPATKKDLKEYLCKDVMRLSGSEREVSLTLVHGYRLGKWERQSSTWRSCPT